MPPYLSEMTNEIYDYDLGQKGDLFGLPGESTAILGILCALLPKIVPHILPYFIANPDTQAKFSDPEYMKESEQSFRDKFVEHLEMVEDIVDSVDGFDEGDPDKKRMSEEFTGFRKFLFGSLEALDVNVADYVGHLEVESVKHLARIAKGEDQMSPFYNMVADTIMAVGSFLYNQIF